MASNHHTVNSAINEIEDYAGLTLPLGSSCSKLCSDESNEDFLGNQLALNTVIESGLLNASHTCLNGIESLKH